MAQSLNTVKKLFESISNAHSQIQGRYTMGSDLDLSSKELKYPRIHIIPQQSQVNLNVVTHTLFIMCVDIARKDDNEMLNEVWSDTQQILIDYVKLIRSYDGDPAWFDLIGEPTMVPILEDYRDRFTGFGMTMQLQVDLTVGDCDIPVFDPEICGSSQYPFVVAPTGPQGGVGRQGFQGFQGLQGLQGLQGFQGNQGNQGFQGFQGLQGPIGNQGLGFQGNQGFQGNTGQAGSGAPGNNDVGVMYLKNNATPTTIPSINGRSVVEGTIQTGILFNFIKDPTTNSLKYIGSGGRFHIVASFNFYSGSQNTCGFYVGLNTNDATPLDPNGDRISESEVYANASNPSNQPVAATIQSVLDLNTNDRVFFIVQNKDATNNITVEFLKYTVTSLTAERGATGLQGWQGNQGFQGFQGFQGRQGLQGLQGNQGNQGRQGNQGNIGFQGNDGNPGAPGPQIPRMISSFWTFNTSFPAPDSKEFTTNDTAFNAITEIRINVEDFYNQSRLELFDDLENLILTNKIWIDVSSVQNFGRSVIYEITSVSEAGLAFGFIILGVQYLYGVNGTAEPDRGELFQITFELSDIGGGGGGATGSQGFQGNQGLQGLQGRQGFQGNQGLQGLQGRQGFQGNQGRQGNQGLIGLQGNQGFQGFQGDNGPLIPRMISSFWQYTTDNTPTSGKFTSDDLTFDNITGIRINIEDIYSLDRRELFNILSSTTTLPFIDLTSIQDFSKSSVYFINNVDISNVGSGYVDLSINWVGSVDGSFTASSSEIYQITFEVKGKTPKFQNITIATSSWAFDSGEGLWFVDISNSFLISQEQSVIFTPYNSTIMEVINAQILPEVRIDDGAQTFRLFAINEPTGDIEGEYIVINAI